MCESVTEKQYEGPFFTPMSVLKCELLNYHSLLAARMAPVMAPLVMEFQGSSFSLTFTNPQSIMEKSPPHTAKLPTIKTESTWFQTEKATMHYTQKIK